MTFQEDEVIHNILIDIRNKWRLRANSADEELPETIVISSERIQKRPGTAIPPEEKRQALGTPVANDEKSKTVFPPIAENKRAAIDEPGGINAALECEESDTLKRSGGDYESLDFFTETIVVGPQRI
jgi:hypothetical protein